MTVKRQLSAEALNRAAEKESEILKVFVGGPFVDLGRTKAPPRAKYGGAQYLRYKVCRYVSDDRGHLVYIGESRELEEIYKGHLKKRYNSAFMELMHVTEESDAVIIFPSSPGSFCELGYFAASAKVCPKLLVVRDSSFLKKQGYLHLGPSAQAASLGAKVVDVSYGDLRAVLAVVDDFLEDSMGRKLIKEYIIGQ